LIEKLADPWPIAYRAPGRPDEQSEVETVAMGITSQVSDGIAEIVMDNPPVNALTVAGWFELAGVVRAAGEDPAVRVVILAAEGKGFNAGVDIKEMQRTEGFDALIGANRGCYAAFAAVYECAVPVIAAVNGYCLGGGIGLVGNADIIVASDDATFGLPEVDRGALGAATHLARLVPQHRMRAMVYTSATATAEELLRYGSVLSVVSRDGLRSEARRVAAEIAAKSPTVIRAAKESLNGIDPVDVKRSYRFEQGFTFELNLSGVADEARDAFVDKRDAKFTK
jgi:enoyl-CoA hydratase